MLRLQHPSICTYRVIIFAIIKSLSSFKLPMKLSQLRAVVVVVDCGKFSEAALELQLS